MKSADIEVGKDYMYRELRHDTPMRVRVIRRGVPVVRCPHYGGNATRHTNGVRAQVLFENGDIGDVVDLLPRYFREPWERFAGRRNEARMRKAVWQARHSTRDQLVEPAAERLRALTGAVFQLDNAGGAYMTAESIMMIVGTIEGLAREATQEAA